jgi:hypothetical protein
MGTGRWGGRGSDCSGIRDAPSPEIAEEMEEDEAAEDECVGIGRHGGRASDKCAARDAERGLATDPPESEAQRKAMWAAKGGHSTLGIPQSVGAEFAQADPGGKLPAHK